MTCRVELLPAEKARNAGDDAERADRVTVRRAERRASVIAERAVVGLCESRIGVQIRDDEHVMFGERVLRDRRFQWQLAHTETDLGDEELAVGVDEIDRRDRRRADLRRKTRDVVKGAFAGCVENVVTAQRRHAIFIAHEFDTVEGHELTLPFAEFVLTQFYPTARR